MVNLFGLELLPSTINFLGYVLILRDLSEISRGGGGGNFKFGFRNEVTHPCNGSEIC